MKDSSAEHDSYHGITHLNMSSKTIAKAILNWPKSRFELLFCKSTYISVEFKVAKDVLQHVNFLNFHGECT